MKITARIGTCEMIVDDGNASEPATARWKEQFEQIEKAAHLAAEKVIAMHKQQVGE